MTKQVAKSGVKTIRHGRDFLGGTRTICPKRDAQVRQNVPRLCQRWIHNVPYVSLMRLILRALMTTARLDRLMPMAASHGGT